MLVRLEILSVFPERFYFLIVAQLPWLYTVLHDQNMQFLSEQPYCSRAGSVFKPKPRLFEETESKPKPTFWLPSASVFWLPGAGRQERICQVSTTKSIIYVRIGFYVWLYSILSIKGSCFYQK